MLKRVYWTFIILAAAGHFFSIHAEQKPAEWIKICEKPICLTFHERLDGDTGAVLVSAGIRQYEDSERTDLVILLRKGMQGAPGIMAAVYSKAQWQAMEQGKRINENALRPFKLKFSPCIDTGCPAEMEATPALIRDMRTSGGLMILAMNPAGKPIGFPVPLDGFASAWQGLPINGKK